jgi:CheY-like chemotaxis protein
MTIELDDGYLFEQKLREHAGRTDKIAKRFVLVVDDEHTIADTLVIILTQAGFDAVTAYSGREAVRRSSQLRPDLIITDVVMPDMNGIDASIAIKSFLPQCKILLFSGQANTANLLQQSRRSGHSFELLTKPLPPADLIAKLRDYTGSQAAG